MLHEQLAATGAVGTSDLSPQARPPALRRDTTARIGFPPTQTRQTRHTRHTSPPTGAKYSPTRARVISPSAKGAQRNRRSGVNWNWVITASEYFHRLLMLAETTGREHQKLGEIKKSARRLEPCGRSCRERSGNTSPM